MKSSDIRENFCQFFINHGHTRVSSSSLIPAQDPTLLFTNAGMVQFKGVFLGEEKRPYKRAISIQKCMRAGGKHNDLENVGKTRRHHTFFEMLGNFSFGDYFKKEAIEMGWEFLTRDMKLPGDRLWVTVFREDDQASDIWKNQIRLSSNRIIRMGEKDNFWQMGETGPCGPCSEIHIDQGESLGCGKPTCAVGCDCDRYLEIWNLVFMQFDRSLDGKLTPLPKPSIDTGMGVERLAAITQGVSSNYDSDLFKPLLHSIAERSTVPYGSSEKEDMAIRVIADHLRALTFLLSDGVLPSNEGRGYVLRRILRRAARFGKVLSINEPFLYQLSNEVIDLMRGAYPDLERSRQTISQITLGEEERFLQTLDQGMKTLTQVIQEVKQKGKRQIPGQELFTLYDTYGFPLDLAGEIAQENQLALDEAGFEEAMDQQRERARAATQFSTEDAPSKDTFKEILQDTGETQFVGYETLEAEPTLIAIIRDGQRVKRALEGESVELILDSTPFYGEGGGQVGDQGLLLRPNASVELHNTIHPLPNLFLHLGKVIQGEIKEGERFNAIVNQKTRKGAERNHTATHLLHSVLRELLGDHVKQAGSLVAHDRLRFDFSHFNPLNDREIHRIEEVINERVRQNFAVKKEWMDIDEALSRGALAFFGDKYGSRVRVVEINHFSKELCGGTHCRETGEIGLFKLVHEGGIASGVRRIEALTGEMAYKFFKHQEEDFRELASLLKVQPVDVLGRAKKLLINMKEQEKEIHRLKEKLSSSQTRDLAENVKEMKGIQVLTKRLENYDMKELRSVADQVRTRFPSGIALLGSVKEGKVSLIILVSKDLVSRYQASELIKPIASKIGGSGGGRPDMAQAGGKIPESLDAAMDMIGQLL
ncbi:MAG TPA: alanine--tRNA ligase [Nitrospiria bacterium]